MTYLVQMEPANALVLALSPNEIVADFASSERLADSELRLALFSLLEDVDGATSA